MKARAEDDGGEDEDKDGEEGTPPKEIQLGLDKNPSLRFDRYGPSDSDTNVDVLHLTWSSKYVCESKADDGKNGDGDDGGNEDGDGETKKPSSHWGFFTWIVVL